MKKILFALPVIAALVLASCGDGRPSEGNKLELAINGAEKVTTPDDYNIYLGSNVSLNQESINAKFDSLLTANKSDRANIVSVKLAEATLYITDSVNTFDRFTSLKLSIFGDEATDVATANTIPAGAKEIKLDVQDKDLYASIKKGEVILMADGNVKGDTLKTDLKTKLSIKLKIEAAPKK